MDCSTARLVWNHPEGFFAGLNEHLPGVMERLEGVVQAFVDGETNPFDEAVRAEVGMGGFFTAHAEDDDPVAELIHDVLGDIVARDMIERFFSERYKQPIRLANICCKGCYCDNGELDSDTVLRIQLAAVNTEPDGTRAV